MLLHHLLGLSPARHELSNGQPEDARALVSDAVAIRECVGAWAVPQALHTVGPPRPCCRDGLLHHLLASSATADLRVGKGEVANCHLQPA